MTHNVCDINNTGKGLRLTNLPRGVSDTRHVSKLAAAANFAFPRNSRFFVLRVATFKTVYVFNIAKTIFREMLTVFLYIVLIRKSRLIIHMQILMMRNDYQANKKEPKLRSTKSSSYFFQYEK